jgi:hypothetical protein
MDAGIVKWLVTGAFALHGAGMVGAAGYLPWSMRSAKADFIGASWLLGSGVLAIAVGVIVWAAAGAGFVAAAIGFWQGSEWWRLAAWVGAGATLLSMSLWFGSVPGGVYVGGALAIGTIVYLILG